MGTLCVAFVPTMVFAVSDPTLVTRDIARAQGRRMTRAVSQQPKALVGKVNRTMKDVKVNSSNKAVAMTVAGSSIVAAALADDAIFETANAAFYYPLELGALLGATVGIYLTLNKVSTSCSGLEGA